MRILRRAAGVAAATACDGHSARGNYQSKDAYDDVFTYSNHDNTSGCNTSTRWTNLSGSNVYDIHYLRARAHTNDTSYYGYTAWQLNPYW